MVVVPRIGTEFAGYRIEALLGRGGMSVVYRAENVRLGNKVALKLLAESLADDESFRERFVRESRTAATLNHPNIVTIYDAGDYEGVLYIAMRWVEEDLKAHVRREGPLPPDHALAVAAQVGSALDAAHARDLRHRDVKPANILLEPGEPGAPPIAYLADFGLTKHLESRSGITASGQFVGTIDYMSPEQIEGREVDSRTDIYSLGCVIFESLAGATPFHRDTEVAVLWAHMREDPPAITDSRPELPAELDGVLAIAMAKSPEDRYGSCRELVADLRQVLGAAAAETYAGRTVAEAKGETPASTPARGTKPKHPPRTARGWLVPALVGAGALLLGVGGGALGYSALRDTEPRIVKVGIGRVGLDERLFRLIPAPVQHWCVAKERLTLDFESSIVCRPRDGPVQRVEYNRAESGHLMADYFIRRVWAEDILPQQALFQPRNHCGAPPGLGEWRRTSTRAGHEPVEPGEDPKGRFICYRRNAWAAVEWTDQDTDVYSVAYGSDLVRLVRWWKAKGGPLPAD